LREAPAMNLEEDDLFNPRRRPRPIGLYGKEKTND